MKIINKLICWFSGHNWTSNVERGVHGKFKSFEEFLEFNKSYCSRCGTMNSTTKELIREDRDAERIVKQVRERLRRV